jgi:hypothetical protein
MRWQCSPMASGAACTTARPRCSLRSLHGRSPSCGRGRSGSTNCDGLDPRERPLSGDRRRRRHRRRRLHRAVDGLLAAAADPSIRVLVIEREVVGFGASGRNGGWCVGELAGGPHGAVGCRSNAGVAHDAGDHRHRRRGRPRRRDEGIDCGFVRGRRDPAGPQPFRSGPPARRGRRPSTARGFRRRRRSGCSTPPEAAGPSWRRRRARAMLFAPRGACSRPDSCGVSPTPSSTSAARSSSRRPRDLVGGDVDPGSGDDRPIGTVRADVVVRATEALHPRPRRPSPHAGPAVLADGRHRAVDPQTWESASGSRRAETFADDRHAW